MIKFKGVEIINKRNIVGNANTDDFLKVDEPDISNDPIIEIAPEQKNNEETIANPQPKEKSTIEKIEASCPKQCKRYRLVLLDNKYNINLVGKLASYEIHYYTNQGLDLINKDNNVVDKSSFILQHLECRDTLMDIMRYIHKNRNDFEKFKAEIKNSMHM